MTTEIEYVTAILLLLFLLTFACAAWVGQGRSLTILSALILVQAVMMLLTGVAGSAFLLLTRTN